MLKGKLYSIANLVLGEYKNEMEWIIQLIHDMNANCLAEYCFHNHALATFPQR